MGGKRREAWFHRARWAESAYSIGGGGQQPSERGGTTLPDQHEGGADPGGSGCGSCTERRPGSCGGSQVTAGCGGLWKGESVGWRCDVSIFLRWRPVQISSEYPSYLSSVPGRQLLGDGKVLDCCVAWQRGNGKWREKGNGGWERVLIVHSAYWWRRRAYIFSRLGRNFEYKSVSHWWFLRTHAFYPEIKVEHWRGDVHFGGLT